ncbi:hypothetical protein AVEN_32823-1 [Araneus ventricosus]|uniref:Uncharacterized protein n=1 Tax=Araneus ventricosus TaxID=182803 RepID=A0A4Y2DY40_ARAVE|nr:hypothetical protein AVEN_32823-1 [Araneus ventricosus]
MISQIRQQDLCPFSQTASIITTLPASSCFQLLPKLLASHSLHLDKCTSLILQVTIIQVYHNCITFSSLRPSALFHPSCLSHQVTSAPRSLHLDGMPIPHPSSHPRHKIHHQFTSSHSSPSKAYHIFITQTGRDPPSSQSH